MQKCEFTENEKVEILINNNKEIKDHDMLSTPCLVWVFLKGSGLAFLFKCQLLLRDVKILICKLSKGKDARRKIKT